MDLRGLAAATDDELSVALDADFDDLPQGQHRQYHISAAPCTASSTNYTPTIAFDLHAIESHGNEQTIGQHTYSSSANSAVVNRNVPHSDFDSSRRSRIWLDFHHHSWI